MQFSVAIYHHVGLLIVIPKPRGKRGGALNKRISLDNYDSHGYFSASCNCFHVPLLFVAFSFYLMTKLAFSPFRDGDGGMGFGFNVFRGANAMITKI